MENQNGSQIEPIPTQPIIEKIVNEILNFELDDQNEIINGIYRSIKLNRTMILEQLSQQTKEMGEAVNQLEKITT